LLGAVARGLKRAKKTQFGAGVTANPGILQNEKIFVGVGVKNTERVNPKLTPGVTLRSA